MVNKDDAIFKRSIDLIGEKAQARIQDARVVVAGAGGVGSFAIEALARAGIGSLVIIDRDIIEASNRNRQLIALASTMGRHKAIAAAERAADINPAIDATGLVCEITGENAGELIPGDAAYILDAVDDLRAKLAIARLAVECGIPLISCMGAGNRVDAARFRVADIFSSTVCPLCRRFRKELRKAGIDRLEVVFSDEPPLMRRSGPPGSVSHVPPVAGFMLASAALRRIGRY